MASAELTCGFCDSYLNLGDIEDQAAVMALVRRFADKHVACGYISEETDEVKEITIKPAADDDDLDLGEDDDS